MLVYVNYRQFQTAAMEFKTRHLAIAHLENVCQLISGTKFMSYKQQVENQIATAQRQVQLNLHSLHITKTKLKSVSLNCKPLL